VDMSDKRKSKSIEIEDDNLIRAENIQRLNSEYFDFPENAKK
jgi:hypothetical protein